MNIRDRIVELAGGDDPSDPLLFLDPPPENADECILGLAHRCGGDPVVAYDQQKVLEELANEFAEDAEDAMTDALEWFGHNTIGAWVGNRTPIFIEILTKEELDMSDGPTNVMQALQEYFRKVADARADLIEEINEIEQQRQEKQTEEDEENG